MPATTSTRRQQTGLVGIALLVAAALAACSGDGQPAGAPAQTTTAPTASAATTPTPTTTTHTTTTTTAIRGSTAAPATDASGSLLATTDAAQPDGTTAARLHVALADLAGPNTDVYINGEVAINGGQPQVNIPVGYVTAYIYLVPGTYQVAVAPTGKGLTQALLPPTNVSVAAGHRYLVAIRGAIADHSLAPFVLDETKVATDLGATPSDAVTITLNDLVDSTGLDYEWAGSTVNSDIPLGGYGAGIVRTGTGHVKVTAKGSVDKVLFDEDSYAADTTVWGFFGKASTGLWLVIDSAPTSELTLLEWLEAHDPEKVAGISSEIPSFTTLRAAITTAALTDMFNAPGTLLFLAPTDKAFAAMPGAQRDALLSDPTALADMLRAHTIQAYVPRGSLETTPGCCRPAFARTFTNLRGDTINVGNDFAINGSGGGYLSTWLTNGTQIHPVDTIDFPPAQ